MFNVIRIPIKYSRTIKRFTDKEQAELLGALIDIGAGHSVEVSDTLVGDTISMIYEEWMNMEAKNGKKPQQSLIKYPPESLGDKTPSDSGAIVQYSIVKDNIVKDSIESVVPKVTTLEGHIKNNFSLEFIKSIYEKYDLTKTEFQEECEMFVEHWKEKNINGTKERWEKEKTFDSKLRFRKWMKNKKDWSKVQIVNTEENERETKLKEIEKKKKLLFTKL